MRNIVSIKAWKTTDGQIFESETTAGIHQQNLDFESRITDVVEQFYFNGIRKDELIKELVSHAVDLKQALGN